MTPNMDAFRRMLGGEDEDDRPKVTREGEVEGLRDSFNALINVGYTFKPGMIVQVKSGLKSYKQLSDNGVAIVVKVLDEPVMSPTDESGSPFYRELADMVIGERTPDGGFNLYHVDSRRYEPAPEESEEPRQFTGRRKR